VSARIRPLLNYEDQF
jgi:hypothetical protein